MKSLQFKEFTDQDIVAPSQLLPTIPKAGPSNTERNAPEFRGTFNPPPQRNGLLVHAAMPSTSQVTRETKYQTEKASTNATRPLDTKAIDPRTPMASRVSATRTDSSDTTVSDTIAIESTANTTTIDKARDKIIDTPATGLAVTKTLASETHLTPSTSKSTDRCADVIAKQSKQEPNPSRQTEDTDTRPKLHISKDDGFPTKAVYQFSKENQIRQQNGIRKLRQPRYERYVGWTSSGEINRRHYARR